MKLRRLVVPAGLAVAAALLLPGSPRPALAPAFAGGRVAVTGPTVALLVTPPGGAHTSLYLARAGEAPSEQAPAATFTHLEGAVVRGAVIPGTDVVLAVADTLPTRDASFAATMFRLAPHRPPELVCDRVVHASRPLVARGGRVFVSRGRAGLEIPGAMRIDELSVDEIDPATGAARTVLAHQGYLAFLAGAFGAEILVYRVGPGGADLVAVDPDTGARRPVAPSLAPFARDFSIDPGAGAIVFQERDELDRRTWTIERIDLASGARARLHAGPSMNLAPFAWPGGGVGYNPDGQRGLALLGATRSPVAGPLGPGVDLVQSVSPDGAWVAGLHTLAGALPVPFAIDTRSGAAVALAAPPGTRVAVAGFVPGGAR
jgi:hypothetical protein